MLLKGFIMDIIPSITLFTTIGQTNATVSLMAQMSSSFFCRMVASACYHVDRCVHPDSLEYVNPNRDLNSFDEQMNSYYQANKDVPYITKTCMGSGAIFNDSVELLIEYAKYKNSNSKPYLIGENFLFVNVYLAMYHFHNWKVKTIEIDHERHGKNFGSAMKYQLEDHLDLFLDWPEKFDFETGPLPELLVLPSKRPGYYPEQGKKDPEENFRDILDHKN